MAVGELHPDHTGPGDPRLTAARRPLRDRLSDRDVVCLSTVDWDFLWQRPHEISARFADDGHRVVYVQPLGIRSWKLRDVPRIVKRVRNRWTAGRSKVQPVRENVWVYSPLALPLHDSRIATFLNRWWLGQSITSLVKTLGTARPIVWAFYATQMVVDIVDRLGPCVTIYDRIDPMWLNAKGVASNYEDTERQLMERADIVFASSRALWEERRGCHPHVYLLPPGVNVEHFAEIGDRLPDLAVIPRPRVCFFGGIDERVDQRLLVRMATAHPGWSIVLIGPIRTDVRALKPIGNVHFIGTVPWEDLPGYLHHMDVLVIPYVLNEYTMHVFPNKIYECLTTGKPTVVTPLPDLAELGEVATVAKTDHDFIVGIEEALRETDSSLVAKRQTVARANSWAARYRQIGDRMVEVLAEKEATR